MKDAPALAKSGIILSTGSIIKCTSSGILTRHPHPPKTAEEAGPAETDGLEVGFADEADDVSAVQDEPVHGEGAHLSTDNVMDPLLYEIFSTESRAHLEVVRQFLARAVAGETPPDEALARALHTMHGSAHMANAGHIAKLAGELERLLKMLMGAGRSVSTRNPWILR